MKKISLVTLCILILSPSFLNAKQYPRALGADKRVKHVMYSPNEVYEIHATYGFQTTIEFSDQENIEVASIGDSIAWQVMPVGYRLFIKPVEDNPQTNLTVITNKRSYYFRLATTRPKVMGVTYLVRFKYPEELKNTYRAESTINKATNPTNYNFDYKLKKGKKSGLIRAFDDQQFTYLQFKNLTDLPAIFLVDDNKKESLVNYRIEGPYVVVERIAPKFVFRRGKVVGYLINKENKQKKKREKANGK